MVANVYANMANFLDNVLASSESNNVSQITLSFTCGKLTNGILIVASQSRNSTNAVFSNITGVTFNGLSLSLAKAQNSTSGSRYESAEIWYLVNPPTGTYDIVVTYQSSVNFAAIGAMSFHGVDKKSPLDSSAGQTYTDLEGNPWTVSITTLTDNCLLINSIYNSSDAAIQPNNGETEAWEVRVNSAGDSAAASYKIGVTPAGATTTGWNNGAAGTDEAAMAVAAFTRHNEAMLTRRSMRPRPFAPGIAR